MFSEPYSVAHPRPTMTIRLACYDNPQHYDSVTPVSPVQLSMGLDDSQGSSEAIDENYQIPPSMFFKRRGAEDGTVAKICAYFT